MTGSGVAAAAACDAGAEVSASSMAAKPSAGSDVDAAALEAKGKFSCTVLSDAAALGSEAKGKFQGKKKRKGREFDWTKATFEHYVLKISYIGTNYHGLAWQDPASIPGCTTVEATLFEALMKTCLVRDREECDYSRCGRTDKGVHAAGNYIALKLRKKPGKASDVEGPADEFDYVAMLNGVLPADIRILAAMRAPPGFHARFSCLYRAYEYFFPHCGEDLDRMREAAQYLVGEHDFSNLCKMDIMNVSNFRRRIFSVCVKSLPGGMAEFAVTGSAFLWHQVRCIVAVLLLVGQGLEEPSIVKQLLDVETLPCKPIYGLADESGLVLRDCGFEGIPFAPSSPAPPAGSTHAAKMPRAASAVGCLQRMQQQALRAAAVHNCLVDSVLGPAGVEGSTRDQPGDAAGVGTRRLRHQPLLQRAACPSYEDRKSAFEARKRRKETHGDVTMSEAQPEAAED